MQGLAIGLTGREGLIKSSVLIRLSSLVLIGLIAHLLNVSRDARIFLWNAVPWIPAVPVFFKMCAAAWIATRLHRDRLLGDRALVTGAAAWLAVVLALYGVLAWILDTPNIRALLPDAPGHPGRPPGAAVRRAPGPRVEPASRNAAPRPGERGWRETGPPRGVRAARRARGAGRGPVRLLLRPQPGQRRLRVLGREAHVPALRAEELRPRPAHAARHQHARRGDCGGPLRWR